MTPIVLQHGLFGFSDIGVGKLKLTYFNGIDTVIAQRGHPLIIGRVHPTSSIEMRARQLKAQIVSHLRESKNRNAKRSDTRVVIIAHSMGGLDARYMISKLNMADRVAALLTVATPHCGSPYADWVLHNLGKRMGGMKLVKLLHLDMKAIHDLTTEGCAKFNEQVEDAPNVRYFSLSGARPWRRMAPIFLHSQKIIFDAEGDNDGMVSVTSSKWGDHLGIWPCDHLHMINRRMVPEFTQRTGNVCKRYLEVLDQLSKEGCIDS